MSASKAKGTRWESAIVDYLRANGAPHAERRALGGAKDRGDIAGIPGVVIEAKSHTGMRLADWVDEAEEERGHAGAAIAAVWHKRRGRASAGAGYVTITGETFVRLLADAGYIAKRPLPDAPPLQERAA